LPVAAAAVSLTLLLLTIPGYINQGFPLDDSWIHAVYARELGRSGMLAYNPGVPATGETSPLWAVVLALPHTVASTHAVLLTKVIGFTLHAAAAVTIAIALASAGPPAGIWPWAAGALVALHPDLVAASVSGMEIPLASFVIALLVLAVVHDRFWLAAACGAAATLARPETAVLCVIPLGLIGVRRRDRVIAYAKTFVVASLGAVVAMAGVCVRNWFVSGRPLPATFYAKVVTQTLSSFEWQSYGFRWMLEMFPLVDQPFVLIVLAVAAFVFVVGAATRADARLAATLFLGGLVFCVTSFAFAHPFDPLAFYHQRYVLPALVLMIAAMPLLVCEIVRRLTPAMSGALQSFAVAAMAALLVAAAPARYRHLSNDTRNIDDVQVAFGKALESADPHDVAWVMDAGAARFFGHAFVVDLVGLNTPQILTSGWQAYLDRHPPRYLDVFADWSVLRGMNATTMPRRVFVAPRRTL